MENTCFQSVIKARVLSNVFQMLVCTKPLMAVAGRLRLSSMVSLAAPHCAELMEINGCGRGEEAGM